MATTDMMGAAPVESSRSALAWGPVLGGAAASVATSVILLLLGSGVGLTMVSATSNDSFSLATLGITAAIWFVVVQWLSSALGGYLTGRLRTKWAAVHTDEVFFRDTAHGLLSWAIATIFVIGFLSTSLGALMGAGATVAASTAGAAGTAAASAAKTTGSSDISSNYFTELLLRPAPGKPAPATANGASVSASVTSILVNGAANGQIPDDDKAYLASVVSAQTGLSQEEATARVNTVLKRAEDAKEAAKAAAEKARKAAATASLIAAASLLVGAFIASAAAALGGSQRDEEEDLLLVRQARNS